eukprot:tig00000144_g9097.t1
MAFACAGPLAAPKRGFAVAQPQVVSQHQARAAAATRIARKPRQFAGAAHFEASAKSEFLGLVFEHVVSPSLSDLRPFARLGGPSSQEGPIFGSASSSEFFSYGESAERGEEELAGEGGDGASGSGGSGGGDGRGDGDGSEEPGKPKINVEELLKNESIPQDIRTAIQEGIVDAEIGARYLEYMNRPEAAFMRLFKAFRDRVLADPSVSNKILAEQGIGIPLTLIGEYNARRENFSHEMNYVLANLIVGIAVNFGMVWFLSPTLMLKRTSKTGVMKAVDELPSYVFDGSRPFTVQQRIGAYFWKAIVYSVVGFFAGGIGAAATKGLIMAQRRFDPEHTTKTKDPEPKADEEGAEPFDSPVDGDLPTAIEHEAHKHDAKPADAPAKDAPKEAKKN